MLTILVKFIFGIITKLFNLIFSPFFAVIYALFPDLSNILGYITSFLTTALTYVSSLRALFLVPTGAMLLLFDYFLIKYSIHLSRQTISFVSRVYNQLKP